MSGEPTKTAGLVSVPTAKGRMIVLHRHAARLASGGIYDPIRGVIIGGDPTCDAMPEGALPLSPSELQAIHRRHAPLWRRDRGEIIAGLLLLVGMIGGLAYAAHILWDILS